MFKEWLTKERLLILACVALCLISIWISSKARTTATTESKETRQEIASLGDRISSMEATLAGVESNMGNIQAGLSNTQSAVDADRENANSQISAISGTLSQLQASIANISTDTQALADIREDINLIEGDIASLEKKVRKLENFFGEEDLVAYYNEDNGFLDNVPTWFPMKSTAWVGQQFTVDDVSYVKSVRLYLKLVAGSPNDASLRLYATGSKGLPEGSPLFIERFNPSNMGEDPDWYEFEISDYYRLFPDEKYVIALEDSDGSDPNMIAWGYDYLNGQCGGVAWVKSYDSGKTWAVVDDGKSDGSFEIWAGVR